MQTSKRDSISHELEMEQQRSGSPLDARADDAIGDDLLRLIFIACHPSCRPRRAWP